MIYFPNGYIRTVQKTGGGFSGGKPVAVSEILGSSIACHYETIQKDKKGKDEDSFFTRASYRVRIDLQEFNAEDIELFDSDGTNLGRFTVQNAQKLLMVEQVLITI
ncbi:MAG: hypothetical protein IKX67_07165 [Bacteroidales bacterium]|nr:hypothetical protein [Bacteroidales bacterium]